MAGEALVGAGLGGVSSAIQTKLQLEESARNRQWQEHLSNTQFQRGIVDLRKAGLNPILATKFGGASTPTGGIAQLPQIDLTGSAQKGAAASTKVMEKELLYWQTGVAQQNAQKLADESRNVRMLTPYLRAIAGYYDTQDGITSAKVGAGIKDAGMLGGAAAGVGALTDESISDWLKKGLGRIFGK